MLCACLNPALHGQANRSRDGHGFGIVNEAKIRPPKAKISNVETLNV